jgi:hypothetical protein
MTNQVQTQAKAPTTKLIGARVPPEFHRLVRVEAAKRDLKITDAVQQGLELWLFFILFACPQCNRPTVPHPTDPAMAATGTRYCLHCQEPVSITPEEAFGEVKGEAE